MPKRRTDVKLVSVAFVDGGHPGDQWSDAGVGPNDVGDAAVPGALLVGSVITVLPFLSSSTVPPMAAISRPRPARAPKALPYL